MKNAGKQKDASVRKLSTLVVKTWRGVLRNQEDLPDCQKFGMSFRTEP